MTLAGIRPASSANVERFVHRTPGSQRAHATGLKSLAGGVSADIKRMEPHPIYVDRAHGSRIRDIDGNEYLDLRMGASALILGHAYEPVLLAVRAQLERGLLLTLPTENDAVLAAEIRRQMPHVELARFVNSGSEATAMAARAARAFTRRKLVARFTGANHGNANDALFVDGRPAAGGGLATFAAAAGLPPGVEDGVLMLPFHDTEATVDLVRRHGTDLAAVITEPLPMKFPGDRATDPAFLRALREVTREQGVLLIFDEMVTGFRLGLGGGAAYYGVVPDLVALGKIIGGGMPIGAYGGRADVMNHAVVTGGGEETIRQSGTHSAHPLSTAAGIAQLRELATVNPYAELRSRGERLRAGLAAAVASAGVEARVLGVESIFALHFRHPEQHYDFCVGLAAEGVYLAPLLAGYLSAAHTDADVDEAIAASRAALGRLP